MLIRKSNSTKNLAIKAGFFILACFHPCLIIYFIIKNFDKNVTFIKLFAFYSANDYTKCC